MTKNHLNPQEKTTLRDLFAPRVWVCLACILALQGLVFYATRIPLSHMTLHRMAGPLDEAIPLRPGWVTVYFLTFLSWAAGLLWIMSEGREHCYRFTAVVMTAQLISGAIFLLYPCTIDRPALTGDGAVMDWMRFLYRVDSPHNLFPSFHVIFSYFCWRGTWGCRKIPRWFRRFGFAVLLLACACILFVKQHVIADIPSALAVSELAWQAARRFSLERVFFAAEKKLQKNKE